MAMKLSSAEADLTKENEGDWIDIPEWAGVRLKVRSVNCRDYLVQHGLLQQKLIKALGRLPTGPEWEPALGKLVATYLLRGWEGLLDDDEATPIEYSPKKAIELLTDPKLRKLEQQVIWAANRVGDKDEEFVVDAVKNSGEPSATI